MPRTLDEILSTRKIARSDVDALFAQFDADGSGSLEHSELQALAARLARRFPDTPVDDMLEILDFYEINRDGRFSREELMGFLQIQLDMESED